MAQKEKVSWTREKSIARLCSNQTVEEEPREAPDSVHDLL